MEARLFVVAAATASAALFGRPVHAAGPTKDECIDANESAQSLLRTGKLLAAKRKLLTCVAPSCPGPVRDDCSQRLNDVEAKTPTVVFEVRSDADRDLSAVGVTMDGEPLIERLDGTAIPVDPGEHKFAFHADGFADEQRTLVIHESDKNRREHVVLVGAPPPAAPAPPSRATPEGPAPTPTPSSDDGRTQRLVALGLGGAGVVGLVIGGTFALVAKSTYDHALNQECNGVTTGCSGTGVSEGQSAFSQATVATVGFAAGAVLLGGGAVFYFTAPKSTDVSVTPTLSARGGGLALRAGW
ncbi:MAG TPA: hypothetical protein VKU41_06745 [Polyangiaceae bacterium]|nr:hypothetical protein [Polyangiaceae bacterium]